MTIFTRVVALAVAGLVVLPWTATAHIIRTTESQSCSSSEFWYETKSCCLPHGGESNPPSPPKGQSCPPSNYYWGSKQGCCVPKHPTAPNPPPQCSSGWDWNSATQCCLPQPSKPTPSPSKPSSYPGGGYGSYKGRKRDSQIIDLSTCPHGLDVCPIYGVDGGYECIDTTTELESCGGCVAAGEGQDCTAIANSWNVGCESGKCAVYTCVDGFQPSADGTSCSPK